MSNPGRPSQKNPQSPKKAKPPAKGTRASAPPVRRNSSSKTPGADTGKSTHDDDKNRIFEAIADHAFYGNVFIDSEGIFRYVNQSFAAMHGYRVEELEGQHISLVHTPEQLAVSRKMIDASIQGESSKPQEHWYLHRDGTEFPLLVGCVSIKSVEGTETYTAMSAVDITPMKQAQEAYQTLFDEMLDGFAHHQIVCDDSGKPVDYRYLAVNPAFERMTGLKSKDLIGRTVREALPGIEQHWIDTYGRVALTGEPARFEDYSADLDKYFEVVAFCPAPGEFATTVEDITKRRRAEDALKYSEQDLQRTQRLAHVGSWTWDFAKDEVTWTEVLFEVFGLEPAATAPTFSEQEALITPSTYKTLNESVARTKETGIPYEIELEIPRDDGTSRWLWSRGEPVTDSEGQITGLWGAAQDITDRKRTEAEAAHLEAQLARAQRLESVGRLAGGMAHDFNNMLTVILGHAEQSLKRIEQDDPLFTDLEEIRQAAERSADLTRRLLAFARNQPASPKFIYVNETVEAIWTILTRLIGEDITLNWIPGENLSSVRMDPSQVDQILANLCVNSRDAMNDGGTITIETKNASFDDEYSAQHPDRLPGDYVELSVTDDGSGMDPETQAHLFEPFFTTKKQGQGTGLGLPMIYGVVKQNQGFIDVDTEPGVGTTFRIYLPQHAAAPKSSPEPVVADTKSIGNETVLLVEDEPGILKLTTTVLEGWGYAVLAAGKPSEAIRLAEEHSGAINLLLTDVTMPEMNGHALAKLLRSSQPQLKCLFMSGYTTNIITAHGDLEDGGHFISKPFRLKDLAAKVRETLGS